MRFSATIILLLLTGQLLAQPDVECPLDQELDEISGLEIVSDSILIAINDGGHNPELILMDIDGNIQRRVLIAYATNADWEDITSDEKYIYVGDFGNNLNKRTDMLIYKVLIDDLLTMDIVSAEKILFRFEEQKRFPPASDSLFFDVEAMCEYNDSLWIFTKNRSNGSDKDTWAYVIPKTPGEHHIKRKYSIDTGRSGWWTSGITAADEYENHFFLLTYTKLIVFSHELNDIKEIARFEFESIGQRESLLVISDNHFLIADEKNPFLGEAVLYSLKWDYKTNE